jgi:hypothetical protein
MNKTELVLKALCAFVLKHRELCACGRYHTRRAGFHFACDKCEAPQEARDTRDAQAVRTMAAFMRGEL